MNNLFIVKHLYLISAVKMFKTVHNTYAIEKRTQVFYVSLNCKTTCNFAIKLQIFIMYIFFYCLVSHNKKNNLHFYRV